MKIKNRSGSPRSAKISNPQFAIKMIMASIPFKLMWFREILKNALQATEKYIINNPSLNTPVDINVRAIKLEGLDEIFHYTSKKISVLNYGGMSYQELLEMPNVFCDSEKIKDFLENFGAGVKLTVPKFSDLLIISKKGNNVHLTRIGIDDDLNLVIYDEPKDVTVWAEDEAEYRGYDMDHDWTDVIVLGKNGQVDQDTSTHLFDPRVETGSEYSMIRQAFQRFYEIPANINVKFAKGTNSGGAKSGDVIFKTMNDVWNKALNQYPLLGGFDTVIKDKESDCEILLRYDPPRIDFPDEFFSRFLKWSDQEKKSWLSRKAGHLIQNDLPKDNELEHMVKNTKYVQNGAGQPLSSVSLNRLGITENSANFSALVWGKPGEQEMYSIVQNGKWKAIASKLGIFSDYNYFKIYVKLPYLKYKPSLCRSKLFEQSTDVMSAMYGEIDADIKYNEFISVIQRVLKDSKADKFNEKIKEHNKANVSADCIDIMNEMLKDNPFKFNPFTKKEKKQVKDKNKNGTKNGQNTGPNKPVMPHGIKFSNNTLTCPKCRRQNPPKITAMPKGQKECKACGYTRKQSTNLGIGTKFIDVAIETPKPRFVEEPSLGEHWARSTQETQTSDIIFVNPNHRAIKDLVNAMFKENQEAYNLPTEVQDQIRNDAFEILKASTGVDYITMKGEMQNSEYYDQEKFDSWTDSAQYTARAKYDSKALRWLEKKYQKDYKKLAKEQVA